MAKKKAARKTAKKKVAKTAAPKKVAKKKTAKKAKKKSTKGPIRKLMEGIEHVVEDIGARMKKRRAKRKRATKKS